MRTVFSYRFRVVFAACTVLLLTLSLIGFWVLRSFTGVFNREVDQFHREQMQTLCLELKQYLHTNAQSILDSLMFRTEHNQDLHLLMQDRTGQERWRIANAISQIAYSYRTYYTAMDDIYIYLKASGILLSTGNVRILGNETANSGRGADLTAGWIETYERLPEISHPTWLPPQTMSHYTPTITLAEKQYLMVVYPLPFLSDHKNYESLLGIAFQTESLRACMEKYALSDAMYIAAFDAGGQLLLETNGLYAPIWQEQPDLLAEVAQGGQATLQTQFEGETMTVHHTTVPGAQWRIVSIVPRSIFYRQADSLRETFLVLLLISGLLSTVSLSLLFVRFMRPLKQLAQNTYGIIEEDIPLRGNEFALVNTAMATLHARVHEYQSIVERDRPLLEIAIFMKWVIGSPVSPEDGQRCLVSVFGQAQGRYVAAALRYDAVMRGEEGSPETILIGIRDLCMRMPLSVYALIMEPALLCIILRLDTGMPDEEVRGLFLQVQSGIQNAFPVTVPLGIGGVVDRPEELAQSWKQAQKTLPYRALYPLQDVLAWREAAQWEQRSWSDMEGIARMDKAIEALDVQQLQAALLALRQHMQQAHISVRAYQQARMAILLAVEQSVERMRAHRRTPLDRQALHRLMECSNSLIFFDELYSVVAGWLTQVTGVRPPSSHMYVEQACAYISEHLERPLSLLQIAEQLQISAGHLSRLFKEHLGESFMEYTTRVRMECMAKRLLEGNRPIQEIAESVGFVNVSYCIRLFKKAYGMTPRQYRLHER